MPTPSEVARSICQGVAGGNTASAIAPAAAAATSAAGAARGAVPRQRASARLMATPTIERALEAEARDQEEARAHRSGDRAERVRGVDARARGPGVLAAARQHAHRERERGADAQRGGNSVSMQAATSAPERGTPRSCSSRRSGIRSTNANAAIERAAIPSCASAKPSAARGGWSARRDAIAAPIAMPARKLASMVAKACAPLPTTWPSSRTHSTS